MRKRENERREERRGRSVVPPATDRWRWRSGDVTAEEIGFVLLSEEEDGDLRRVPALRTLKTQVHFYLYYE